MNRTYYLDRPGGQFSRVHGPIENPRDGEIRVRIARTSVCQSDVIIHRQGLPRIRKWPAILLHEASAYVDAVGAGVERFQVGDLVGFGCDLPCPDSLCPYCGDNGTGDWTSCPNTHATGHEYPGFARDFAILPEWFVARGPIVRFPRGFDPNLACHLEPLACCLEGMTRVNDCIQNRLVAIVGAGSQGVYALQVALALGARKVIVINRGTQRLLRAMQDFYDERVVGLSWNDSVVSQVHAHCAPFASPHFVMVCAPAKEAYDLGLQLMGSGTVLDLHAGIKGSNSKPAIHHTIDLNNDIHYRLQCYQATHGSTWRSIRLASEMIIDGALPRMSSMTNESELFSCDQLNEAFHRAAAPDSLKVVVDWEAATPCTV